MGGDVVYLSEGDGDASVQLNVICQLSKLVLLLLKSLQQTVDLLLGQHNPAVILHQERCTTLHQVLWTQSLLKAQRNPRVVCVCVCVCTAKCQTC